MNLLFPRSVWTRALYIALVFTFCAISVRFFWGYPRCQNDELNWVQIAHNLDSGHDWPVSGPSFIYVLRNLREQTQMHYRDLISGLGIVSVFIGSLLIILGYSRLRIAKPGLTLVALALSSYFWVPLLEARPQQWGQILVFLGAISAWLWLHKRGGWLFFPILLLVSVTHILSHAILVFVCTTLALADYFENHPLTRRHAILIACMLASLMVYVLPAGPYQTMLRDIEQNHLRRLLSIIPYLAAMVLAGIFTVMALKPRLHWREHWSRATIGYALTHENVICIALLCIFFVIMAVQATVLPSASWLPYGGSISTFLVFQAGNLVFAVLFARGTFAFLRAITHQQIEILSARMVIWSLLSFAILGCAILAASFFLLDTNWLLRLINYAILFAAPIAALGLAEIHIFRQYRILQAMALPLFVVSICQAVRPEGFLGC